MGDEIIVPKIISSLHIQKENFLCSNLQNYILEDTKIWNKLLLLTRKSRIKHDGNVRKIFSCADTHIKERIQTITKGETSLNFIGSYMINGTDAHWAIAQEKTIW